MVYRSNYLLRTRLEKAGYYEAATIPGLWSHKWRPIQFVLIVDDFGIKYVGKQQALHILKILQQNYEITTDREDFFSGIDLAWDYNDQHANRTCRISMNGYIKTVLLKYGHPRPIKAELSPHKHREVIYGSKEQLTPEDNKNPPLDNQCTKRIQGIFGAFLYHVRAVDNKLLVRLSSIGSQQSAATKQTKTAINQLLDYCATYPSDRIFYRSSDMVLCAHSDAGFHNKSKVRSRAGSHISPPKTMPCPGGTAQFSVLPILLNSSCPLLQKQNWGHFSLHPEK